MAVRRSGIQMTSVTLVRGKKNCCLGKALMCCYREAGMVELIQVRSTSCVMLGKKKNAFGVGAKHVPWLRGITI